MFRQRIPGLSCMPAENIYDKQDTACVTFDMHVFTIPGAHKYGNCRVIEEFTKLHRISRGTFGSVYKVRDNLDGQIYALKSLHDRKAPSHTVMPQKFLRQINNLKMVKHLNVVNLKEVIVSSNLERNYLLLDYCEYSLRNVIDHVDSVFLQHRHIKNIMHQMLDGLQYIHRFNIIHRDLCPKNVLFNVAGILKISDFGSSRTASDVDMTPNHVLRWYRAPEILFGSTKYTKAVDVWAVGCMFAEMMRQKPLFRGETDGDIVRSMIDILGSPSERHWPGYSKLPVPRLFRLKKQPYNRIRAVFRNQTLATVAYLTKFLKYNPASRPTVEDVMRDQYYAEHPHDCSNQVLMVTLRMSEKL